jgi:ubiquinone/menaquinone biosynthesis C-methylase UbiE
VLVAEPATVCSAQVRELFDAKAATWSSKYAPGGRLTRRLALLAAAVEQQTTPAGRVLDFGCGTGDLGRRLAAAGRQVTACDISAAMLDRAAQADPAGAVEWTSLDPGWRTLPFADGTFGTIVASSVLEYVSDPALVLRECARLLEPGGTLLCTVPDLRHPVRWLEGLLSLVVRAPLTRAAGGSRRRLGSYLTYLRISQQRHAVRWWRAAAAQAGLGPTDEGHDYSPHGALRLLMFRQSRNAAETQ